MIEPTWTKTCGSKFGFSSRNMEPAWEKVQGRKFALSSRTIEHVWEKVSQGKISQSSRMVVQPNSGVRELPSYIRIRTECLLHRNELSVRSFGQVYFNLTILSE